MASWPNAFMYLSQNQKRTYKEWKRNREGRASFSWRIIEEGIHVAGGPPHTSGLQQDLIIAPKYYIRNSMNEFRGDAAKIIQNALKGIWR